jgi:hypothetical protein
MALTEMKYISLLFHMNIITKWQSFLVTVHFPTNKQREQEQEHEGEGKDPALGLSLTKDYG